MIQISSMKHSTFRGPIKHYQSKKKWHPCATHILATHPIFTHILLVTVKQWPYRTLHVHVKANISTPTVSPVHIHDIQTILEHVLCTTKVYIYMYLQNMRNAKYIKEVSNVLKKWTVICITIFIHIHVDTYMYMDILIHGCTHCHGTLTDTCTFIEAD